MKKAIFIALLATISVLSFAQEQFKGTFISDTPSLKLRLNLYEKSITLKDLDFDETYGYMDGDINGTWVILKVKKLEEKKALVRMVSDIGIDAQNVEFSVNAEGKMEMKLVDEQNIKAIAERKYVKMPKVTVFTNKDAEK